MLFLLVFEDLCHGVVFTTGQSAVNHGHQMFGDGGNADLLDEFAEEAAHHELAGVGFGDAAGFEVEQFLVVEAAHRRGVTGTDDVAVFDFEVRLGIGDGARGQDQVAVELVGVGAGGGGLDERVAHPSGVRALAVERALVDHAGLAVGVVVYHHRAVFDVLAGSTK